MDYSGAGIVMGLVIIVTEVMGEASVNISCVHFDYRHCTTSYNECMRVISCPDKRSYCSAVWEVSGNNTRWMLQDCFPLDACGRVGCRMEHACVGIRFTGGEENIFHCTCLGNLCNRLFELSNVTHSLGLGNNTKPVYTTPRGVSAVMIKKTTFLYYVFVPVLGLFAVVGVLFYLLKKHKSTLVVDRPLLGDTPPPTPVEDRAIRLVEIVARGQFGNVWRAYYRNEVVAVKSIPRHEKFSWTTESTIYTRYDMSHDNILRFVGAEKRLQGLGYEYWILTEFQENGSVVDFLRSHVIDWTQCLRMVLDTVRGVKFLHSDVPGSSPSKPAIAHRDLKSRNVLVKSDFSCCISDFGLAFAFPADYRVEEAKSQVGTKRYMAPEVLQGSIVFQPESFLSIDMYALALVLWEIVSRCNASQALVGDYKAPFEDEVGFHPSLEDMLAVVVERKVRPKLQLEWFQHKGMQAVCRSIEDCWDQDGDARLTVHCLYERLATIDTSISKQPPVNSDRSLDSTVVELISLTSASTVSAVGKQESGC